MKFYWSSDVCYLNINYDFEQSQPLHRPVASASESSAQRDFVRDALGR